MMKRRIPTYLFVSLLVVAAAECLTASETMKLSVDCTIPKQGYVTSSCVIPVDAKETPQRIGLWYPKWVPGSHGPGGPVANIAGLVVKDSAGNPLEWKRTPGEVYRIDVDVPGGVGQLVVDLRYIVNQPTTTSFGHDCFFGRTIGVISPSCLLLYRDGVDIDQQKIELCVEMPASWKAASAMAEIQSPEQRSTEKEASVYQCEEVTLRVLLDSPIMLGRYYRVVELADADGISPPHSLHLFSDGDDPKILDEKIIDRYREMVRQTSLLMGSHPFDRFDILLGITDQLPKNGLEHSRSTFNILPTSVMRSIDSLKGWDRLLVPHEYLHAWCGKYRRPSGMVKSNFHTAKDTELLWVYEGLTQYLGELVEARCGLMKQEEFEARLFVELRNAIHQDGRKWRTLADTGAASHILRSGSNRWGELRRSQDYYMEGMLFWLEVDARLRSSSDQKVSIDDFCQSFFKRNQPLSSPHGYDRGEVVDTLNQLLEYDWDGLIRRRIEMVQENFSPEVAGLLGYRMEFGEERQAVPPGTFRARGGADFLDSLGLVVSGDGVVTRVKLDSVGSKAGLVPGDKIITVGEQLWSLEAMTKSVRDSRSDGGVNLTISEGDKVKEVELPYSDGARYWRLVPVDPDTTLLQRILHARKN